MDFSGAYPEIFRRGLLKYFCVEGKIKRGVGGLVWIFFLKNTRKLKKIPKNLGVKTTIPEYALRLLEINDYSR